MKKWLPYWGRKIAAEYCITGLKFHLAVEGMKNYLKKQTYGIFDAHMSAPDL